MLFRKLSKNQRNIYFSDDKMRQKYPVSFKKHIVYSKNAALAPGVCPLRNMARIIVNSCIDKPRKSEALQQNLIETLFSSVKLTNIINIRDNK